MPAPASDSGPRWTTKTIKTIKAVIDFPTSISCASAAACDATGFNLSNAKQGDVAVAVGTTNGWTTSARQTLPLGTTELFGVACPSASRCEAAGNAGAKGGVVLSVSACTAAGLGATDGGIVLTGRSGR